MLIDAHAHLHRNPKGLDALVHCGRVKEVWLMDVSGCRLSNTPFAEEHEILEVARNYPGFFIPFGYLDFRQTPDIVDRLRDKGFVGLKVYRPLKPYDAPEYFPFYERAAKLRMPILFHTGILAKCPKHLMGENLSYGPTNMKPAQLASIAAAFPDLILIGGHLGYPWLEETAQNLYYYPNIYHDLSGYRKEVEWLIRNLDRKCNDDGPTRRYFNDKILFATDYIYGSGDSNELAQACRMMDFWELFLEYVGGFYYRWGEPEERRKIFFDNAMKLMASLK